MTDEFANLEVLPAVRLEYFERHTGPWAVVVRIMACMGVFYSATVIASEVIWLVVYLLAMVQGPFSARLNLSSSLLSGFCPAIAGWALLIGCTMAMKFQKSGRTIVLWASAGVTVAWMLAFGISEVQFVLIRSLPASLSSPLYIVYQTAAYFLQNLFRAFPAVMLWMIFHRREVRDLFEG